MGGHASISALVDDEHGYVSSDVEADNKEDKSEEKENDKLFHFHDAEHVGLLFIGIPR